MKKNNIEGWLFVSPLVIWISLIILVPIYIAFELSLFNVKIIGTSGKFVGIDNYIKLFGKSKFLMLHTINKSPFEKNTLETCLRLADDGASILYIEDGVYSVVKNTKFEQLISDKIPNIKMYVLEPDLKARGLDKSSLINNIEVIDYQGFVKLAVENEKIQNWL